jgi:hypothetical protein
MTGRPSAITRVTGLIYFVHGRQRHQSRASLYAARIAVAASISEIECRKSHFYGISDLQLCTAGKLLRLDRGLVKPMGK